ncbi:prolactin-releasing peptide receptor-like [Glandiceps talaboti]
MAQDTALNYEGFDEPSYYSSFSSMYDGWNLLFTESENVNSTTNNITIATNPFQALEAGRVFLRQYSVLLAVFYGIVFLVGTVGNAFIVVTVGLNKNLRNFANYLISNLALSHCLMCIFCIPWTLANSLMDEWVFGEVLCKLVPFIQTVSVFVSIISHVIISCGRLRITMYPLQGRISSTTCVIIIVFSWTVAVLVAIPVAVFTHEFDFRIFGYHIVCYDVWPSRLFKNVYDFTLLVLGYIAPLAFIAVCYTKVCLYIHKRVIPGVYTRRQKLRDLVKKQKLNRQLIAITTTFAISWLPLYTVRTMAEFNPTIFPTKYYDLIYILCHASAMSSSVYNPIIYAWMHKKYRRHLKSTLFFKRPKHTLQR